MEDEVMLACPDHYEGKGIAAALVAAAYNYGLENGLKPKATCSYAIRWLQRHPELNDIVEQ